MSRNAVNFENNSVAFIVGDDDQISKINLNEFPSIKIGNYETTSSVINIAQAQEQTLVSAPEIGNLVPSNVGTKQNARRGIV